MRRGASWTAAYHLQLTVAAVARPVRSSVVPSESLLPSGPGCCSPRRRLPGGAPCRHPAGGGRRRGRQCQDAGHGVGRRSASTVRCPPTRCRRPGPGSPARPVFSPSGVRSPGVVVRGPAGHPSSVQLCGVHPSGVQPVWCRPRRSGRVRLLPHRAVASGTRPVRRGTRHHRNRSRSWWAAAPSSGSVDGRAGLGAGDAAGVARWSVGSRWRPGRVGCGGRAYPLRDQAGQAGVRSAAGWRRGVAAPAGWLPLLGWVGDHGAWWWWSLPPGWTGPGRADGRAGG